MTTRPTLAGTRAMNARRSSLILIAAAGMACLLGLAVGSHPVLVVLPALAAIPFVFWQRPQYAVVALLGASTLVEQWGYTVDGRNGAFTDRVPFFRTIAHGTFILPVEVLIVMALVIWVLKSGLEGSLNLPLSPVAKCLAAMWVLLFIGTGVGLSHGAQLKNSLWEIRPWLLLSLGYVLAAALLRTRRALDAILWTLVVGSGFKAIQGTYIFFAFARGMRPRPEAILGHEEAFFFGVFVVVTAALWLYGIQGRLRWTATALLPFVLLADMANSRRVAWLILGASLATLTAIAWVTLPHRRRVLGRVLAVVVVGGAVYLPAYWNHSGTLAQPARAVRSLISPNQRDQASDLYRQQEDANLLINIQSSGRFGRGFGIPIAYVAPIADISGIDQMIAYIPHNGLLWVWLRLGIQGEIVLLGLVSAALIRACQLARAKDPKLALFGAVGACTVVAYVLMGYNDLGFAWLRIALGVGCLLGAVEAATRLVPPAGLEVANPVDSGEARPVEGPGSRPRRHPAPARAGA